MDITPTADDKGLQRLKLEQQNTAIKPLRPVETYPRIPDDEHQLPNPPPPHQERRQKERRQGERRQQDDHRSYDTRSHQERRQRLRREADRAQAAQQAPGTRHIDEQV
ncbi:MAG: hypothetical protein ACNA75_02730 [Thiohalomonadaceae bacterium]